MADSTVTIVGNVTRDPELRYTPSGQAQCRIGVAVNRVWTDRQSNEKKEQTSFFNVTAWGSLGENAGESLVKGARVVVTGRLEQRSWETPDGEKKSTVEIIADEIGPSLRWATAQVVRNERRSGDGGGFGGGEPSAPRPIANESASYGDEEPF
jgi:single-strand DNA-binding protein